MAGERILVVDDEPGVRTAVRSVLSDEGYDVVSAESAEDGLLELEQGDFDAILLDVWLPGMDGLEALRIVRERRSDAEVVMISGHGTIDTAVRATKLGAFDFVEKPLSLEKMLLVLRNALRQRRLERRNRQLLEQLARETEIVGRSAAADRLRADVEIAVGTDAPVLISGEAGSGRESVARRIHSAAYAESPFVEVPCAALDAAAAAQALFGKDDLPGRIAMAAGGSLFLEDVDRLALDLQRKLSGALDVQARRKISARVLASVRADGDDLDEALRQRLEVVRIDVPALRERREDVPLLAERFMGSLAREYGRQPKQLAPDCLLALKAYQWPGNIRDLRNLIERLLLLVSPPVVQVADLPEGLGGARTPLEDLYRDFASLEEGRATFERYYIARVMSEEHANRPAAAKRLGIDPFQ